MRRRRSAAALAVALAAAPTLAAHAQGARPPAGRTIDESRAIALPARVDAPCVAVRAGGASILIARAPLEAAALATPAAWTTEPEREARVRGVRAKALLALADAGGATAAAAKGCRPVDAGKLGDASYLVAERLEAGEAAVIGDGAATVDRTITVRYVGVRAGPTTGRGEIRFLRSEPGRTFYAVDWWSS